MKIFLNLNLMRRREIGGGGGSGGGEGGKGWVGMSVRGGGVSDGWLDGWMEMDNLSGRP